MTVTSSRRLTAAPRSRVAPEHGALALLLLAAGLLLLLAGRHLTFFYDEWDFIVGRRGGSIDTYLDPHNGHLSLFPVAVYKLLFVTVGLRHYWPYRVVEIALHLLCGGLLYVLLRRRIGAWPALVPTALLLFMGSAFQDLLWPFQMGYLGSIAGGLGALALLELPASRRRDACACALLIWSVASSGVGIPFLFAAAVLLLARRERWSRLWVVAVPAILFLAWYVGWGAGERITSDAVLGAPQYVADAAAGATAGIAGLDDGTWGVPLLVALLAVLTLAWRAHRGDRPTPMLLAATGGALAFWVLTAVTRFESPDPAASRYLYIGAVFILIVAAEAKLGTGIDRAWLVVPLLLAAGAIVGNLSALRGGERAMRGVDDAVGASLGAVEVAAPVVSPAFQAAPGDLPGIAAGPYLAAVHSLGSPVLTVSQLEHAGGLAQTADQVLVLAERLAVKRTPPTVATTASGQGCRQLTRGSVRLQVSPGGSVSIKTEHGPGARLYVRRFSGAFQPRPLGTVPGASSATVAFPADRAPQRPWTVRLVSAAPLLACAT
jgi:hypothetical protein